MIIRPATPDDADVVGAVTCQVYVGDGYTDPDESPGYVASLADGAGRIRDAEVFVAELGGDVVGTVTATRTGTEWSHLADADELEVRMLAVLPVARGRGIASALMSACEELARSSSCRAVVLCSEPTMHAAHRLYESRGYRRTPDRDWSIGGTTLLAYELDLTEAP